MNLTAEGDVVPLRVCEVHEDVALRTNVILLSANDLLNAIHQIESLLPSGRGSPLVRAIVIETFRWLVWKTGANEDHADRFATLDQISEVRITTTHQGVVRLQVKFNKFLMDVRSETDDAIIDGQSSVSVSHESDDSLESKDENKVATEQMAIKQVATKQKATKQVALDVTNCQTIAAIYALSRSIRNVPNCDMKRDKTKSAIKSSVWRPVCIPAFVVAALLMLRHSTSGWNKWSLEADTSCTSTRETTSEARLGLSSIIKKIQNT